LSSKGARNNTYTSLPLIMASTIA